MKKIQKSIVVISILFLLIGCVTQEMIDVSPTISLTSVNNTAQSAASTLLAQTMTAVPILTVTPTIVKLPPTLTNTPLPFMELEGLRVVYVTGDGDLYVEDSGEQRIRLTQGVKESTENRPPLISDDGQKIVFYRTGESDFDAVYVINADGTGEQALITREFLSAFGDVYDELTVMISITFVPGTHLLIFNTYQPHNYDPESLGWLPLVGNDLFIVDTNTGKIIQLKEPWQGGNFLAAPNGKWIAVQSLDHIEVIDLEGRIIRHNLVTYDKNEAHVVVPMVWTSDSKELIILPSNIPLFAGGATVDRTVWRYPVNGSSGTKIDLNPPPVYDAYAVSPDGNWIAYIYYTENNPVDNPKVPFGLYIGNLHDGTSRLLYSPTPELYGHIYGWSPDNIHFAFSSSYSYRIYIGSIYGEIIPIGRGEGILGWVDNNHYVLSNGVVGDVSNIIVFDDYISYFPIAFVYMDR